MLSIGRRIYYDKFTGNKLVEIGERQGSVRETTIEEDFQTYVALAERLPETVGCIQLEYGQYREEFNSCTGYHIDIETSQIIFSYAPVEALLDDVKMAQINKLWNDCNQAVLTGFYSSCRGQEEFYTFSELDQTNIMGYITMLSIDITTPVIWKSANDTICAPFTAEQMIQLGKDALAHKQEKIYRFEVLRNQILTCSTKEEVEAIVW